MDIRWRIRLVRGLARRQQPRDNTSVSTGLDLSSHRRDDASATDPERRNQSGEASLCVCRHQRGMRTPGKMDAR
jgi:hypothetical protein